MQKYDSDNHNDFDNDKTNQQYYNLSMVIYDNLFWYQLFASALTTKLTI